MLPVPTPEGRAYGAVARLWRVCQDLSRIGWAIKQQSNIKQVWLGNQDWLGNTIHCPSQIKALQYTWKVSVLIFEGITETGAEKFVVHIHVNLARKEGH